jgi:hypothetical protein
VVRVARLEQQRARERLHAAVALAAVAALRAAAVAQLREQQGGGAGGQGGGGRCVGGAHRGAPAVAAREGRVREEDAGAGRERAREAWRENVSSSTITLQSAVTMDSQPRSAL